MTNNIREGIWLIPDGIPLRMGNMTICTTNSNKLLVTGFTNVFYIENVSKEKILQELNNLKISYSELTSSYKELNDIIQKNNLDIEYHICYDDSGKAGIGLCSEINGELNWYID